MSAQPNRGNRIALLLVVLSAAAAAGEARVAGSNATDIDVLLRNAVEQKRVPMVVAMVADANRVVYEQALGVDKDAIFAIASMTKPVTSVAVMQLVESGRVKLDDPAATYVPELATIRVRERATLRAPKSAPTVRQLLTHTAGFAYEFLNREAADAVAKKEVPSAFGGGEGFLKAPLVFDPGTHWQYGINTDWLGRLVERVSGRTLDAYFREKIFAPLGMADTFFVVPPDKQRRMVKTFQRNADGSLVEPPPRPTTTVEFFSGGGGLFSTAQDYLTFSRAIMAGGELGGRRILSKASIEAMGRNQIGELTIGPFTSLVPQLMVPHVELSGIDKFGLGFALNSRPLPGGRGANTMSWAGIFNTFFWIDREKQIAAVFMTQMLPFMDPGAATTIGEFDRAVYAWRNP